MPIQVLDVQALYDHWWVVLLRGIAGVIFGVVTFVAPGISLAALVLLFGAYAFADGLLTIVTLIRRRRSVDRWWLILLQGIMGIAAGVITLFWPGITAIALLYVVAFWAVVTGVLEMAVAIRLRSVLRREWLLGLSGLLSLALGVLLIVFPASGALALTVWIGAFVLVYGALLVALSFRLRSLSRAEHEGAIHGVA